MSKHYLLTGVSLVAALLLASCANGPGSEADPEANYPISVGPHVETLSVANASPESMERISAFGSAFVAAGNGSITVSAPSAEAARMVTEHLSKHGVPRDRIVVGAASQNGSVQISYVGYGATSPQCGDWSENIAFTMMNLPTPNFGCATQHNLAAEIADPRDLVSPQPMTPPDTERRMIVIDHWRKGEPTSSQKTQEQSGAVSDVARD